jgi:hypothetical protein
VASSVFSAKAVERGTLTEDITATDLSPLLGFSGWRLRRRAFRA